MAIDAFDLDLFWDPNFGTQDLLPGSLFDANYNHLPGIGHTTSATQPSRIISSNFSRFSSRLPPPLEDTEDGAVDDDTDNDQGERATDTNLFGTTLPGLITESVYGRLRVEVQCYSEVLPTGCSLPSRNTLSRYLEKYLLCVQEFLAFIHISTFQVEQKSVEMLLGMAALGSLYSYEHPKSYEMYCMAKAIFVEKKRRGDLQLTANLVAGRDTPMQDSSNQLGKVQTFILLITFASWGDKNLLPDAMSMGSELAALVRDSGISESDEMPPNVDWLLWISIEEKRRTLLAAYVLFNLQCVAFNVPPLLLNYEIGVFLPSYAEQWSSKSATQWQKTTRQPERQFRSGLQSLLDGTGIPKEASMSSFSNYILIHGLLQQIYIDHHGSMGLLRPETIKYYENALRSWQLSWESSRESTLDPMSPKGPLGLSSAALLRLAYIRLNSDISPRGGPLSSNLRCRIGQSFNLDRSPQVDKAIVHAVHALSIPVRLGIALMARTKMPIWGIEHSICSLECALLLKAWLLMISVATKSCGTQGLRKVERKLLGTITAIIKETWFADTLDIPEDDANHIQRMASTVAKIWAQIFQGVHILEIDNCIGANLQILADSSLS